VSSYPTSPILFPFPLGKGLGVRLSIIHDQAKNPTSDGTNLPMVVTPT
jgi:hypothetical protein